MQEIDLRRFERHIQVRPATPQDFDDIVALQEKVFPGMKPWTREQLTSHHQYFPEGQIVVEHEGRIIGSSSSLIVDFDEYNARHSFTEVTGGGTLETHDPEGTHLYGVEIMVDPDFRKMRVGRRLYDARKRLAEQLNLASIVIAGRMPGYHKHENEMTPEEYVRRVVEGSLRDPVLTFQLANGFVVKRVLSEYLPRDGQSRGNAVLMQWNNILYRPQSRRQTALTQRVRVCVVQYQMRRIDSFDEFAQQCEYFVDVAAGHGSDFVLFPELLTTQLLCFMEEREPWKAARQLASYTEDYIRLFTDLALGYNVNIIGGTHLIMEEGVLHNVAFLFRRDGTIEKQYKVHVTPNERRWWGTAPGNQIHAFDTDVGRIGIQICYDVEFPEMSRVQNELGARIIFVPFCTEDRQGYLRVRYCAQARAIENQMYVVTAGTVGNLPQVQNMDVQYAQSAILTPSDFDFPRDGIVGETTPNVETVVIGDIDLDLLRRHRRRGTVMQLRDRRHDLYQLVQKIEDRQPAAKIVNGGDGATSRIPEPDPKATERPEER